ncbi:MAG: ABC transporter substrate-binding protein [Burkholderiaceae bacterium]
MRIPVSTPTKPKRPSLSLVCRQPLRRALLAAAALLAVAAPAMADPPLIAIVNFGDHPALRETVDGFKQKMTSLGRVEGKDIAYDYQHVNFDRTLIPQMLQRAQSKKPVLVFSVTTGVTQATVRGISDKTIPIVFASVVDPVVAKIVPAWSGGSPTYAGASMLPDFDLALAFVKQVTPGAKRVGTLYNPGEDNDTTNIELITKAAKAAGLELVTVAVDNPADIPIRMQSLVGKVDVVFLIQSNVIQTSMPVVAQVAQRLKLPVINSVYDPALKDQLAGFYAVSYRRNGEHAAVIADRILKGTKPADIAVYVPKGDDFVPLVSPKGLASVGRTVPDALKNSPWLIP